MYLYLYLYLYLYPYSLYDKREVVWPARPFARSSLLEPLSGLKASKWGWNIPNGAQISGMGLKRNTGKCFWPAGLQRKSDLKLCDDADAKGALSTCVPNNLIALAPFKCLLAWSCHRRQTINWCHIKSWHVIKFWEMDNWVPKKVNQLVFPKHNQPISKPAKVFSQWQWAVSAGAEFFSRLQNAFSAFYSPTFYPRLHPLLPQTPSYRVILGVD